MRRFSLACVFTLLICLWAVNSFGQSVTPANTPFKAAVDHDGANTTGYRCYLDGVKQGADLPLSARVNGVVTCDFPAQPASTKTIEISAYSAGGEAKSAPLTVSIVAPAPKPPTNIRLVTVQIAIDAVGQVTGVRILKVE